MKTFLEEEPGISSTTGRLIYRKKTPEEEAEDDLARERLAWRDRMYKEKWEIQEIEQYIKSVINRVNRKIQPLVLKNEFYAVAKTVCDREDVLALLDAQNRESVIFNPIRNQCNGTFLLTLRYKNPEDAREKERKKREQDREEQRIAWEREAPARAARDSAFMSMVNHRTGIND